MIWGGRYLRLLMALLLLVLLLASGVYLICSAPIPMAVKLPVFVPVLVALIGVAGRFGWLHLGCLLVDPTPTAVRRIQEDDRLPERHRWEIELALHNPNPWAAHIRRCAVEHLEVVAGPGVALDSYDLCAGPLAKSSEGSVLLTCQCSRHDGPCARHICFILEIEYSLGGGRVRTDRYEIKCALEGEA